MDCSFPHFTHENGQLELIVEGKSTLLLGGELRNSSSSSLDFMEPIWEHLQNLNLNFVLIPVSWRQFEPEEGQFEVGLVEGLIRRASQSGLRVGLLWLATWKNGFSGYAPSWMWRDRVRFPRMSRQALSPFSIPTLQSDQRAFCKLMEIVRAEDPKGTTVVMMQVENEIGLLGDSRDRSPAAERAFCDEVPLSLTQALEENEAALKPEIRKLWTEHGRKHGAPWKEVFGHDSLTDEIFMAWHMASFVNAVAEAGKAIHPLPMFVNAWTVDPSQSTPGIHPSGGPVARMLDIWKTAAPEIDLYGVDNYRHDFRGESKAYSHRGNPLFIPEAAGWWGGDSPESAIAKAFYAMGSGALGYCPFGIDNVFYAEGAFSEAYKVLREMEPLMLIARQKGRMCGFYRVAEKTSEELNLGRFQIKVHYAMEGESDQMFETGLQSLGAFGAYGLIIQDEHESGVFWLAGRGFQADFRLNSDQDSLLLNLGVEEGRFNDGKWSVTRVLNGDEVPEQGTGGIKMPPSAYPVLGEPYISIQRVKFVEEDQFSKEFP